MKIIILLSVIALAFASPIDDKNVKSSLPVPANSGKQPDISTLPLKKDEPKTGAGVQAHPLHKRDAPKVADQLSSATQASGLKVSTPSSVSQGNLNNNNQRQPLNNQNNRPVTNSNNQPLSNKQQPPRAASNLNGQNSNLNAQKNQQNPTVNRPLSQSNQPILSQSARTKRDTPKPVDQKTPTTNSNKQFYQTSPAKAQPTQASRITRENPKPVDSKAQAPQSNKNQKPQEVSPVKPQTPTNSRTKRDTQKPVDQKTPVAQAGSNSNQKHHTAAAPLKPQPTQASRITRENPKPVDTKAQAPQTNTNLNQKQQQPLKPAVSQGTRVVRDAPNPHEQSKIVPSGHQPSKKLSQEDSEESSSNEKKSSSVHDSHPAAKVNQKTGVSSNYHDNAPLPSSSSSNNNQSPQFVHPKPIDEILKKDQTVTVTKSDTVKITPALPTSDSNPIAFKDSKDSKSTTTTSHY